MPLQQRQRQAAFTVHQKCWQNNSENDAAAQSTVSRHFSFENWSEQSCQGVNLDLVNNNFTLQPLDWSYRVPTLFKKQFLRKFLRLLLQNSGQYYRFITQIYYSIENKIYVAHVIK